MCVQLIRQELIPLVGGPALPFIDQGGEGLQMGERGKYQGYRRSFEGSGSSFFPAPALYNMADSVRSGVFVDLHRPCPGLFQQVGASHPAPRVACRTGLLNSDPVGTDVVVTARFAIVEDRSLFLERCGCRMSVLGSSPSGLKAVPTTL